MAGPTGSWRGRAVSIAVAILILAAAAWFLADAFSDITLQGLQSALAAQPAAQIAGCVLLTGVSFVGIASYDVFAARVVAPGRVGIGVAALAGAASNAVATMLGFHAITATAVRLRVYNRVGLNLADIARITALSTGALALGFAAVLATAFALAPGENDASVKRMAGIALIGLLAAFIWWLARAPRRFALGRFSATLPPARLAFGQMVIGGLEMAAAIGSLYVLMPTDLLPSFGVFAAGVVGAMLLGIGSQAPAGLGAFEASIVVMVGGAGRVDLLAALLLYRAIHNVLPFVVSLIALALFEIVGRSR